MIFFGYIVQTVIDNTVGKKKKLTLTESTSTTLIQGNFLWSLQQAHRADSACDSSSPRHPCRKSVLMWTPFVHKRKLV